MRAITIMNPWAWAICHAGKDIENRTWNSARLRWRDISREMGVSASTFSRMGLQHLAPNADNLVRMLPWLGDTDLKPYILAARSTSEEQG